MFIRAVHNGLKKKIKGSDKPTFEYLVKELVRCFGEGVKKAEIGYYDEDQEFIRLTNQDEWEICVEETQIKSKGKEVYTVEVHVLSGDNAIEASTVSDTSKSFISAPMIETTKSDIQDWRVIGKTDEDQKMMSEPILHHSMSEPTEPSIFEEPAIEVQKEEPAPQEMSFSQSFVNHGTEDILVDIKVTGTHEELERIQRTVIHQFAPHAGFEVEKCEVLVKRDFPEEMEDNHSVIDSNSQLSHMTAELKDEIETLIEEKLKKLSLFRDEPKMNKKSGPTRLSSGNYDHGHVTCDNCFQRIVGCARFKSVTKKDFDLCETCEATGVHPEPLIKIRNPIGHRIGMKLNAEFDTLKNLFVEEQPKKVQVTQPLCHIRRSNEENIERISNAEKSLKSIIKTPTLCHIRTTQKVEEKKPVQAEIVEAPAKPQDVEQPKVQENPMLKMLVRIFPHHDANVIADFLKNNQGLSLEEIVNRFMDFKF